MSTAREDTVLLVDLLRREHLALADFLVALAGFHRDRRWVELGYSSLFNFLVRELGLSKGAAFYRNRAAELVERFPAVIEPLRDGRLCLSSVAALSDVLTADNLHDVLPRYYHLSRAEAKEVSAALKPDPAPPLRTIVTDAPRGVIPPSRPGAPSVPVPASAGHSLSLAAFVHFDAGITPSSMRAGADPAAEQPAGTGEERRAAAGFLENLTRASSTVPDVAPLLATQPPRRAEVEPLTGELRRVHVTVPRTLLDKLAAARDALSHSHPGASDAELLELGLDLLIERQLKRRGIGARPRRRAGAASPTGAASTSDPAATTTDPDTAFATDSASAPATAFATDSAAALATASAAAPTTARAAAPTAARAAASGEASAVASAPPMARAPASRSRHVPADAAREVWNRDRGCCTWKLENGEVCGSTRQVEIDHVEGWARGAGMSPGELRLLCRFHQDIHARALYGDDLMNRFTRPKGPRCSEPVAVYGPARGCTGRESGPWHRHQDLGWKRPI